MSDDNEHKRIIANLSDLRSGLATCDANKAACVVDDAINELTRLRAALLKAKVEPLACLADIRAAIGDPTGKLMLGEVVERVRGIVRERDAAKAESVADERRMQFLAGVEGDGQVGEPFVEGVVGVESSLYDFAFVVSTEEGSPNDAEPTAQQMATALRRLIDAALAASAAAEGAK